MATLTDKTVANTYDQLWFRGSTEPGGTTQATQVKTTENDGTDDLATPLYLGLARVGIGTSSPAEVLDVTGNIKSSGTGVFGGALTCATSLTIGSAAMVEADLEKLDGITDGTAAANKAVVLDGSKNIATLGTVGCGAITSSGVVTGTGFTIGSAAIIESELEMLDGISAGTAAASKAVVLDGSKNISTIGTIGCGAITTSGTLTVNAAAVFNEGSGDYDFRVESNTSTHAIFVDAGTPEVVINDDQIDMDFRVEGNGIDNLLRTSAGANTVGIGCDVPATLLDIASTSDTFLTITAQSTSHSSGINFSNKTDGILAANAQGGITYDHHGNYEEELLQFRAGNNGTHMTIDGTGNVGIGTEAPAYDLEINQTGGGDLCLTAANTDIGDGNDLGSIYFRGTDSGGGYPTNGAMIRATAAATWSESANDAPTELTFWTQSDSTGSGLTAPRMTIDSDGKVGIGTDTPTHALVVKEPASGAVNVLKIEGKDSTDAVASLTITDAHDEGQLNLFKAGGAGVSLRANGNSYFTNGNVGIGTSTFNGSATQNIAIANGASPSAHTDNQIYIHARDSSDNASTLALFTEHAVEDVTTWAMTSRMKIWINGAEYWIALDEV